MNKYRFLRFGAILLAGATLLPTTSCSFINSDDPITDLLGDLGGEDDIDEETGYSKMLINVLNNENYKNLIESAKYNTDLFESPEFDPHPYAFLEDEGIDVNKIKDGTYSCYTMSFVKDDELNNLYMHTRVLIDDTYYQSYLLKYELTDQEMKDYQMIHGCFDDPLRYYSHIYFLNNEISELKKPTIVGTSKMEKSALESTIRRHATAHKDGPTEGCHSIILDVNKYDRTLRLLLIPHYYQTNRVAYDNYLIDYNYTTGIIFQDPDNEICNNSFEPLILIEQSKQKINATFFFSQDADFRIRTPELENEK